MENFLVEMARAFALLMVLEGIIPFLNPGGWKRLMANLLQSETGAIRVAGLVSMLLGLLLLYLL